MTRGDGEFPPGDSKPTPVPACRDLSAPMQTNNTYRQFIQVKLFLPWNVVGVAD